MSVNIRPTLVALLFSASTLLAPVALGDPLGKALATGTTCSATSTIGSTKTNSDFLCINS